MYYNILENSGTSRKEISEKSGASAGFPLRARKKKEGVPPSEKIISAPAYAPPEGFRPSRRAELSTTHTDDAL